MSAQEHGQRQQLTVWVKSDTLRRACTALERSALVALLLTTSASDERTRAGTERSRTNRDAGGQKIERKPTQSSMNRIQILLR
jgi:hypothetical protein